MFTFFLATNETSLYVTGGCLKGFLFDENIPSRLTFIPSLPMVHSNELGQSLSDTSIWEYALRNEYMIVTKDTDFTNRIMLSEPPPWVIHLRIGNLRKRDFHTFLARIWSQVESLLPLHKLVIVYKNSIEAIR